MTGRHPFRTNVPNHGHYMRPHETTIAEAQGLQTRDGPFGKWHIRSLAGSPTSPGGAGFDEWLWGWALYDDPIQSQWKVPADQGFRTVISMNATIDFLTRHHSGEKPMFVILVSFSA